MNESVALPAVAGWGAKEIWGREVPRRVPGAEPWVRVWGKAKPPEFDAIC